MRNRVLTLAGALGIVAALAACEPGPAVSVTPDTGLVDGQEVTVRGSGYSANANVGILQCRAGAQGPDACDRRTADSFSTNGAGGYTRAAEVFAVIEDAHGVVTDCRSAPGACEIVSVYIHGFHGRASAPLTFAAG